MIILVTRDAEGGGRVDPAVVVRMRRGRCAPSVGELWAVDVQDAPIDVGEHSAGRGVRHKSLERGCRVHRATSDCTNTGIPVVAASARRVERAKLMIQGGRRGGRSCRRARW